MHEFVTLNNYSKDTSCVLILIQLHPCNIWSRNGMRHSGNGVTQSINGIRQFKIVMR